MALNWKAVTGNFLDQLYNVLKAFEAPTLAAVPVNGNLTIGLGFDLRKGSPALKDAVLLTMGLVVPTATNIPDATARAIEKGYRNQLTTAFNGSNASALTTIMAARAANPNLAYVAAMALHPRRPQFVFNSETEVHDVYGAVVNEYLNRIYTRYPELQNSLGFTTSRERLVLGSLVWNGGTGLLGNGLRRALQNGDRAEAWYEIRFNSNSLATKYITQGIIDPKGIDKGLARRRFAESEIFGLYDNAGNITETDAKSAYRTLTRHRDYITQYEAAYGQTPDGVTVNRGDMITTANTYGISIDGSAVSVGSVQAELLSATTLLTNTYALGTTIAWNHIQVGEDLTTLYYKGTDADLLTGTTSNDLILGDSGTDILDGGPGQDVLYGGPGNDVLTGGQGNDVLQGGPGLDLYRSPPGDGNDTIIDSSNAAMRGDGLGLIVYDPALTTQGLAVGLRHADAGGNHTGPWHDPTNTFTYQWSGTDGDPLTITTPTGTLTLPQYRRGDLSLRLIDVAPDTPSAGLIPITNINLNPAGTINTHTGTTAAEIATGTALDDDIYGRSGGDRLFGGAGADHLYADDLDTGSVVSSYLDGGTGRDAMIGGAGDDHLVGGRRTRRLRQARRRVGSVNADRGL